jgi:translation initiation factor 3 subunit J
MEASWEDIKEPQIPVPKKLGRDDRWEGEDEEEDVKDNWDDDDEVSESQASEDGPKPAPTKKKTLAQKIAEKEEKARQEAEEKRRQREEAEGPKTAEEILADKLEKQRLQEESDLRLAEEAFGINEGGAGAESGAGLDDIPLSSRKHFEAFQKNLVSKLQQVEKSPHYVGFLENTFRDLCVGLEPDDIKRVSSNLTALFNEKIKAQKATKGKKTKPKGAAALKMERNPMDYADGGFDDMDDFM